MSIFDSIEKLITEHGSATILSQQFAFAKDQFSDLERKVADLQKQIGDLEAQLERERMEHKQAREELQRLRDEHSEEIRIHNSIEFRRGKRTGGLWAPFCPKCHTPCNCFIKRICALQCCLWLGVTHGPCRASTHYFTVTLGSIETS